MGQARAEQAVNSNIKSLFGDYVQCIYEDYHLLVVDGSYQTGSMAYLEERLKGQLSENLQGSLPAFDIHEVMLTEAVLITDDHFASLKKQLHDYCGYAMTEDLLELIKRRSQGIAEESPEAAPETTEAVIDTDSMTDPRSFFNGLFGNILLSIVCPAGQLPSQQVIILDDLPAKKARIAGETSLLSLDFLKGGGISELISQAPLQLSDQMFSKEAIELAFYVRSCFHTWIDGEAQGAFTGEQEYILYGNNTDRENVLQAVQGMILLRMPFNYGYLYSTPSKRAVIKTAAAAIAVLSGSQPAFVEQMLLGAVSYGESVLDVKALLHGEAVSLVKTDDTWRLDITDFLMRHLSGRSVKDNQNGLYYQDYLTLLLLLKGSEDKFYYRLLDLITLAARQKEQGFTMDYAVTGATVQYSIEQVPKFSHLPQFWNQEAYHFFFEKTLSY